MWCHPLTRKIICNLHSVNKYTYSRLGALRAAWAYTSETGKSCTRRQRRVLCASAAMVWPWTLTFWPKNVIRSSVSQDAPVTQVWRKSINRYWRYSGNMKIWDAFGHAVTLNFDLLTPISNQFISVPRCTSDEKFGENPSTDTGEWEMSRKHETTAWITDGRTDARTHARTDSGRDGRPENI